MYLWLTDPHFDKFNDNVSDWGKEVRAEYPRAAGIIVTGDISTSQFLETHLKDLAQGFSGTIYFVVGNHDYWHSSFREIDELINTFKPEDGLVSLENKFVSLTAEVALIGSSGFYDAIYGEFEDSPIEMNDWYFIEELTNENRLQIIRERSAHLSTRVLEQMVRAQKKGYSRILIATHFPPFIDLIKKDSHRIPFYGSAFMGSAILAGATTLDEVIVLSGHSHIEANCVEDGKIFSYCGKARYGLPEVIGIFDENEFEVHLL